MKIHFKIFFLCFVFVFLSQCSDQPKYNIILERESQVGQRFEVKAFGKLIQKNKTYLKSDNSVLTDYTTEISTNFEAISKVEQIDSKGSPIKVSLLVSKFTKNLDGNESEVVPSQTIIYEIEEDHKKNFYIDGKLVDKKISSLFSLFTETTIKGPPVDEIYKTNEKRALGEKWKIDSKKMAELFNVKQDIFIFSAPDIAGNISLQKIEKVNDLDSFFIKGNISAKTFQMKNLPAQFRLKQSSLEFDFEANFPKDMTNPFGSGSGSIVMKFFLEGEDNTKSPGRNDRQVMAEMSTQQMYDIKTKMLP